MYLVHLNGAKVKVPVSAVLTELMSKELISELECFVSFSCNCLRGNIYNSSIFH